MIDRQHLAIIREVSRAGSVTAAAERLNLSQSALSHAIAKLEARFGISIWQKHGRSLRLEQAGEYLLEIAERFVPELEDAERVLRDFAKGRKGRLRIGMECHPCQKWLMRITRSYLTEWPDVDLEVRTGFRFDGVAALQAHEIDLLVTPDPVTLSDLRFVPVFDYELRLAVHDDHPLAGRESVTAADLVDETLITVPVSVDRLDIYTHFLIPAQCRPRSRMPVETIELMLQLVAAGRGISVLPDWLVREECAGMPIRTLRIGRDGLYKQINLGTRTGDREFDYVSGFFAMARSITP